MPEIDDQFAAPGIAAQQEAAKDEQDEADDGQSSGAPDRRVAELGGRTSRQANAAATTPSMAARVCVRNRSSARSTATVQ